MHDRRHAEPLRWGPFALDLRARELRKDGHRIRLQDKPFELLVALIERPGEVVSREELRSRLWPSDTFVAFDDGLNTAVSKLREALGDSVGGPQSIETVPRRGYRFIAPLDPQTLQVVAGPDLSEPLRPRRRALALAATIGGLVALAAGSWAARTSPTAERDPVRFEIRAPDGAVFGGSNAFGVLSPDGRRIAFRAVQPADRSPRLWVQALDGSARWSLQGTDLPEDFTWSPDGRSIAFRRAPGDVLRHDLAQGVTVRIAGGLGYSLGLSWHDDVGILIGQGPGQGLCRVGMDGAVEPVTTLDAARAETIHAWPQILADGKSFIYLAKSRVPENDGVYLARFGETSRTLLLATPFKAIVAEPDTLVYLQGQHLVAQRFDLQRATLLGEPIRIAAGPTATSVGGAAAFSLSRSGTLAHTEPRRPLSRETIWLTRAGQWISQQHPPAHDAFFSLSPDGRWVVFERQDGQAAVINPELWLLDVERSATRRITHHPGNDEGAVWAPDSRRFVYARHRAIHQPSDLYIKDLVNPDVERPLLASGSVSRHPFDWSADGRFILYSEVTPGVPEDIWVLPLDGDRRPYPWLTTRFHEGAASFSPNGRWIVYESDESGRSEIYVRAFDDPRARWQISTNGGKSPQWRRDGRELYYISADHRMMAVPIQGPAEGTDKFEAGVPVQLFELRRLSPNPQFRTPFAVTADGQRFLVGAVTDEGGDQPITVLLNWRGLLSRGE